MNKKIIRTSLDDKIIITWTAAVELNFGFYKLFFFFSLYKRGIPPPHGRNVDSGNDINEFDIYRKVNALRDETLKKKFINVAPQYYLPCHNVRRVGRDPNT